MAQEPDPRTPADDLREQAAVTARLEELLGDRSEREVALVTRLVSGFPAKASGLVEQWRTAVLQGEHGEAVRAVHTLKGTALNLGSTTLSRVCQEIESWSRDGDPECEAVHRERLVSAVAAFARTMAGATAGHRTGAPQR